MQLSEFQAQVIEKSQETPVVVDFWAPWCGPCRVLGPVIEELALEANGTWELVKVNTEESEALSRQYQIMSIPAVKMFHRGEVIAEFMGALPRTQIERWLEEFLPDERKGSLEEMSRLLAEGNPEKAIGMLRNFVAENPEMVEGRVMLAKALVFQAPDEALDLVHHIREGDKYFEDAHDIGSLAELMQLTEEGHPKVLEKIEAARAALQGADFDTGLDALIQSIMMDKSYGGEVARRASIAIFHLLGETHPISKKHRPLFGMALY